MNRRKFLKFFSVGAAAVVSGVAIGGNGKGVFKAPVVAASYNDVDFLMETSSSEGGFIVPKDVADEIDKAIYHKPIIVTEYEITLNGEILRSGS